MMLIDRHLQKCRRIRQIVKKNQLTPKRGGGGPKTGGTFHQDRLEPMKKF